MNIQGSDLSLCVDVHVHKTRFTKFGVERVECPAQSPDLDCVPDLFTKQSLPEVTLITFGGMNTNLLSHAPTSIGKPSKEVALII